MSVQPFKLPAKLAQKKNLSDIFRGFVEPDLQQAEQNLAKNPIEKQRQNLKHDHNYTKSQRVSVIAAKKLTKRICEYCGIFYRDSHIERHIRNIHKTEESLVQCEFCYRLYLRENLPNHIIKCYVKKK